ncbi:hypothetical protein MMC29_007574 [Sticta canariensis]|nr:hypothetical protein [Sticta canariensis]
MDDGKPFPARFRPELVLKPVIKELARTQVCFPDLKLLVDRISIVTLPSTEHTTVNEAYRLYLTDGERTIQAVLKRNCHKHVTSFDVREGSYVILRNYRLARGRKLSGVGSVIYVIIEDFYSIGEQPRDELGEGRRDRYIELIKSPQHQPNKSIDQRYGSTARRILHVPEGQHQGNNKNQDDPFSPNNTPDSPQGSSHEKDFMSKGLKRKPSAAPIAPAPSEQRKRKRDDPFGEIDPNLSSRDFKMNKPLETFSVQKTSTGPNVPSVLEHDRPSITKDGEVGLDRLANQSDVTPTTKLVTAGKGNASTRRNNGAPDLGSPNPANRTNRPPTFITRPIDKPKAPIPIKRPLQLRTLASLTGQHATRNKVHDVFAVICFVDASVIKPASMPPKRDMRIMDRSTDKKVLVSVFVDPAHFQPAVGTVALFRSLTTHEWDRGMLNVYPQQCGGKAWFVPDPVGVPGCDVDGLKDWWRRTLKTEMEAVEGKGPPQ